jgi:hypothetical protein
MNAATPRKGAPKKTDAEKGPLAAWAYAARSVLNIPPEDAAAAAKISYPTLRKIEGGSYKTPARRVVWELWQFYAAAGRDQHVPVPDPPAEWREPIATPKASASPDLAAAITLQAQAIDRLATQVAALIDRRDEDLRELARTLASLLATPATRQAEEAPADVRPAPNHRDQ